MTVLAVPWIRSRAHTLCSAEVALPKRNGALRTSLT